MPDFLRKKYKIRKATTKSGHEVSIPPPWISHREEVGNPEEEVEVLYNSIIVIVPPGVRVNKRVLAAAVEEIPSSESDKE